VSNTNLLAAQAHPRLVEIWSDRRMVETEWLWWIHVMELQHSLGVALPPDAVAKSRRVLNTVGAAENALPLINTRERITKHDLKARLEVFCGLAGHEYHHLGLTSADVVENVYQIRVRRSLLLLSDLYGLDVSHLNQYPLRGCHGPVGTDQDLLDLLGSPQAVDVLNARLAAQWGFPGYARCVPQIMHRSYDLAVLAPVVSQTKARRPRTPWNALLSGYLTMVAAYAGDTWNEGDVSSSVVRRVAIPNLLFTLSAMLRRYDYAREATDAE
jgi:adenylosuccinate lyase